MNNFKFENKIILLISPEFWGDFHVSKHHYARALSKKSKVYFLNPPTHRFQSKNINDRLFVIDYKPIFKGVRYLPDFFNKYWIKKEINVLEVMLGLSFNVIWSFDPSRLFNLSHITGKLRICHIVDLNQVYQRKALAKSSDICFTVSENIKILLENSHNNVYKINHGYQVNYKAHDYEFITPGTNKLKAFLIGNLSRASIDWKIIKLSAIKNNSVDFIFIGPLGKSNLGNLTQKEEFANIKLLRNVYFLNAVKSFEIPEILTHADILIVSFKEQYHEQQTNSHKIMEYFGSGKTIVATKTLEYINFANTGLIAMSDKNEEFPRIFSSVVHNIEQWNGADKCKQRRNYALDNSYDKQIDRIESLIIDLECIDD